MGRVPAWKTLRKGNGLGDGSRKTSGTKARETRRFVPFRKCFHWLAGASLDPRAAGRVLWGRQIVTLLCQLAAPLTLNYTAHPLVNAYNRVASSAMVSLRC